MNFQCFPHNVREIKWPSKNWTSVHTTANFNNIKGEVIIAITIAGDIAIVGPK